MPGSRRLALALLWLTVGWNVVEGVIAVASGVMAGSVALIGFGLDSFIEVTAAGVLIWRLGLPEHAESAEQRERTAHRVVGVTFLALALTSPRRPCTRWQQGSSRKRPGPASSWLWCH